VTATPDYWNHNAAYHRWVLDIAGKHRGNVLDIGCGEGLLAQRLATVSRSVTAIDPDSAAIDRARERLAGIGRVTLAHNGFHEFDAGSQKFDVITFVASLHHMELADSLLKARELLTPTGEIAVVGLSANHTLTDWLISAACLPAVRIGSRWHGERRDIGVAVAAPRESLSEIRITANRILPGAVIRRGLYYRYLLRWSKPQF
jgi:SAM-dependent methyltransferase